MYIHFIYIFFLGGGGGGEGGGGKVVNYLVHFEKIIRSETNYPIG